ncbi:hypothetical protein BDQ12DRAFT_230298 [Crucibulum laeve]|uniref:Uncharacterized protein n=1 Tax=Crucibulum laeve TaxID=68775 RepID=A0A5C3LXR4_9AGAR|nr:hypothetical protein BDQ12DRAFT_230298 [Crucibulum laeve]
MQWFVSIRRGIFPLIRLVKTEMSAPRIKPVWKPPLSHVHASAQYSVKINSLVRKHLHSSKKTRAGMPGKCRAAMLFGDCLLESSYFGGAAWHSSIVPSLFKANLVPSASDRICMLRSDRYVLEVSLGQILLASRNKVQEFARPLVVDAF